MQHAFTSQALCHHFTRSSIEPREYAKRFAMDATVSFTFRQNAALQCLCPASLTFTPCPQSRWREETALICAPDARRHVIYFASSTYARPLIIINGYFVSFEVALIRLYADDLILRRGIVYIT